MADTTARSSGGFKPTRRSLIDGLKFLGVAGVLIWLIARGSQQLGYNWQWYQVPRYFFEFQDGRLIAGPLVTGIFVTLQITVVSLVLAFCFGLLTAFFRLSDSLVARFVARAYLEIVRNTPLLVQLFFIYFVLSPILGFGRFASAVLALSLFEGAYASEILRAGIVSIQRGQWEAARSLGLRTLYCYRLVILPQALRRVLPPLTSQAISLIKDSALVSTIAIYDLTMQGQAIVSETFMVFEVWFVVAAVYLVITITLSVVVNIMETRLQIRT
ncbi:MAG: amino acid ABC transporter permease [Desulfobacterales bacterium]